MHSSRYLVITTDLDCSSVNGMLFKSVWEAMWGMQIARRHFFAKLRTACRFFFEAGSDMCAQECFLHHMLAVTMHTSGMAALSLSVLQHTCTSCLTCCWV
jgi:hypothetical protein